ncbi:flagellar basal-body MS-ring/collar protein FliF [Albibacillus kandeliae]|uniref:flagellar basal-body MS-ring/collar protein FliF n=1 Tax=Albibacillus kandeliae TaxID=2174228 RepID=UPI001E64FE0F|nr:flagellar basal-body MS-ring/collar protein FliF [Albibacillus kandeliae]
MMLGGTGFALLLALFFGMRLVMAPDFVQLYGGLSPSAASSVVDTLEQSGFNVKLSDNGATVSVPRESLPRARMALADAGLPSDGTPGWELFDESSGLGMNSFLQRVNRLRALEGELSRSIQTIDGVAAARVHLVLPEREAFSRQRPEPSASVIVRGTASHQISRRQGNAIRALVAAAVPDLSANRVTVLSASGETILSEEGDGAGETTLQSVRAGMEERMAQSIAAILQARVGAGNARVQVNVNLDSERKVVRQESYDPSQRVVRSTETQEESRDDRDLASGEVGVNQNIPAELANDGGDLAGERKSSERTREIVNYEIGKTESETVREPGEVQRISVAVLVNGIYNVADNGTVSYEERSPEELARLEELVKSAVGFDEARGDSVSVDSLRFMDYSMDVGDPVGQSFSQLVADNFTSILRGIMALAVIGTVVGFGVRPLMRQVQSLGPEPQLAGAGGPAGLLGSGALEAGQAAQLADMSQPQAIQQAAPQVLQPQRTTQVLPVARPSHELVHLSSVQGGVERGWIDTVTATLESHPEESLRVIKSWLAEDL